MTTALIGEGNEASVRVQPYLTRSGKKLSVGTVELEAWIERDEGNLRLRGTKITKAEVDSAYRRWKKRALKQWKEYLAWEKRWLERYPDSSAAITSKEGGALDSMRAWTIENPLTVTTTFDNEAGPDFSKIFEEAPVIDDTPATRERLKDYAMHLRAVISNHDGPGLYQEIRPAKNAEYRKLGRTPPPDSVRRADWAAAAEKRVGWFQPGRSAGATSRDEIGVRQWVGGRVWELYKKDSGEPLFGESGIFVAEVGGELKVVRVR